MVVPASASRPSPIRTSGDIGLGPGRESPGPPHTHRPSCRRALWGKIGNDSTSPAACSATGSGWPASPGKASGDDTAPGSGCRSDTRRPELLLDLLAAGDTGHGEVIGTYGIGSLLHHPHRSAIELQAVSLRHARRAAVQASSLASFAVSTPLAWRRAGCCADHVVAVPGAVRTAVVAQASHPVARQLCV